MPQVTWPTRTIPCATLALVNNTSIFFVRRGDREFLPIGQEAIYRRTASGTESTSTVYARLADVTGVSYQITTDESGANLISPVAPSFTLEVDAGLIVNYPARPILSSPSMQTVQSHTNPRQVGGYDTGEPRYTGSVEMVVRDRANAGIIEAFIDQLYDPRNWFELPLPGDHLGTSTVTAYNPATGQISIGKNTDENYHGWWVRVGNRTGRITSHSVGINSSNEGNFVYAHQITITPSGLITGTGGANNFSNRRTMRVRATSVSAVGDADSGGAWVVEFEETAGD